MKTKIENQNYSVIYNNDDDCRTVIDTADRLIAYSVALAAKRGQRFFQNNHSNSYHSRGNVRIYLNDNIIYEQNCTKIRK